MQVENQEFGLIRWNGSDSFLLGVAQETGT